MISLREALYLSGPADCAEGGPDGIQQQSCSDRLREICDAAKVHRLSPHDFVTGAGHEDDRELQPGILEMAAQFDTRNVTKVDIDDETACLGRYRRPDEFFGRR